MPIVWKIAVMNITTDNNALIELYQSGRSNDKRYSKLSPSTVRGFVKAVNMMKNSNRIEDLYRIKGLHYERLKGNLRDFESVRCDLKYRLIFKSRALDGETIITEVGLLEITDHYGAL